jgi:hypothetical protein
MDGCVNETDSIFAIPLQTDLHLCIFFHFEEHFVTSLIFNTKCYGFIASIVSIVCHLQ